MGEIIPMRSDGEQSDGPAPHVRTFLIADIRGYTAFTRQAGDEAAARLVTDFARLTRSGVEGRGGELLELRGDEALAVFTSPRQALRAALDLQSLYAEHSHEHPEAPLNVGIGIDAGEAVAVEGGFRGSALNMAARLCGAAMGSEILATEAISHLAGPVEGLTYADGGKRPLKGMTDKVRVVRILSGNVVPETVQPPAVYREPSLPSIADFTRDVGSQFGRDIGSMVNEHLRSVNQQIQDELQRNLEMNRAQLEAQRRDVPPEPEGAQQVPQLREIGRGIPGRQAPQTLRRQPQGERTSPIPWIVAAVALVIVVAVAIILWTHFL